MTELSQMQCKPCEGGVEPLSADEAARQLDRLAEGWQLDPAGREIRRDFRFSSYFETMSFVNAVAWIANTQDHHPDLEVSYGRCLVRYTTHAIAGLSENDFICAARIDALTA